MPMAPPSCALNRTDLAKQLDRYRTVGEGSAMIERDARRRVLRVSESVSTDVINELISVERGCCPFFDLRWQSATRRLVIAVTSSDHEPALDAISHALGSG